jgi:hypothetical protein
MALRGGDAHRHGGQNENALGGGTDEKQEPSLGAIHAPSPPFASQPLVKVREQGLEASD